MKKIAVFGGNFDPPHIGHLTSITNVFNSGVVDEVMLVPAGDARYDKRTAASAEHRRAMLELMLKHELKNDSTVRLNDCQLKDENNKGHTIELLETLKGEDPSASYYILIGADNVSRITTWHAAERLLKEANFLVLPRGGVEQPSQRAPNFLFLEPDKCVVVNVSSTQVRVLIKEQAHLEGILSAPVAAYIRANKLYF